MHTAGGQAARFLMEWTRSTLWRKRRKRVQQRQSSLALWKDFSVGMSCPHLMCVKYSFSLHVHCHVGISHTCRNVRVTHLSHIWCLESFISVYICTWYDMTVLLGRALKCFVHYKPLLRYTKMRSVQCVFGPWYIDTLTTHQFLYDQEMCISSRQVYDKCMIQEPACVSLELCIAYLFTCC